MVLYSSSGYGYDTNNCGISVLVAARGDYCFTGEAVVGCARLETLHESCSMRRGLRPCHSQPREGGGWAGMGRVKGRRVAREYPPGLSSQRSDALRALVASLGVVSCSDLEGFGKSRVAR